MFYFAFGTEINRTVLIPINDKHSAKCYRIWYLECPSWVVISMILLGYSSKNMVGIFKPSGSCALLPKSFLALWLNNVDSLLGWSRTRQHLQLLPFIGIMDFEETECWYHETCLTPQLGHKSGPLKYYVIHKKNWKTKKLQKRIKYIKVINLIKHEFVDSDSLLLIKFILKMKL